MQNILFILGLLGLGFPSSSNSQSAPTAKIDPNLIATLDENVFANIILDFVGSNREVLNVIQHQVFPTRGERLTTLKSSLEVHAASSQQMVKELLAKNSIPFRSFWISNQISIKDAGKDLVEALARFPEVEEIYEEIIVRLDDPIQDSVPERRPNQAEVEWGIKRIQADEAWRITNGSGVVVGGIDTGVSNTHESLRDAYRTPYGWMDTTNDGSDVAVDYNGHGTHTMGTVLGSNGIGVAPGAKWMACRACGAFQCEQADLIECGEFMLCPSLPDGTDHDCFKAPAIVTNSWGGGGSSRWYEAVTETWVVGGLVPIFSGGNLGPECTSAGSPGDYRRVIGVGSISEQNVVSYFSSLGPARDGRIKPELAAPGENIRSALSADDASYLVRSGSSMACPHVSGVAALLLSVNPDLTYTQVREALISGTDRNTTSCTCSCSNVDDDVFPNFHFGFGVVNALSVVEAAVADRDNFKKNPYLS